jgi:hypothetical protein
MTSIRDGSAAILGAPVGFCCQPAAMYLQPSPPLLSIWTLRDRLSPSEIPIQTEEPVATASASPHDTAPTSHRREPATPRIAGGDDPTTRNKTTRWSPVRVVRYSRLPGAARAMLDRHGRLFVWNRAFAALLVVN